MPSDCAGLTVEGEEGEAGEAGEGGALGSDLSRDDGGSAGAMEG